MRVERQIEKERGRGKSNEGDRQRNSRALKTRESSRIGREVLAAKSL